MYQTIRLLLQYSTDGITWTKYKGRRRQSPIFTNILGEYSFQLDREINARYVHITPHIKDIVQRCSLKTEGRSARKVTKIVDPVTVQNPSCNETQTYPGVLDKEISPSSVENSPYSETDVSLIQISSPISAQNKLIDKETDLLVIEKVLGSVQLSGLNSDLLSPSGISEENIKSDTTEDVREEENSDKYRLPHIEEIANDFERRVSDSHPQKEERKKRVTFPSLHVTDMTTGIDAQEVGLAKKRQRRKSINRRHTINQKLGALMQTKKRRGNKVREEKSNEKPDDDGHGDNDHGVDGVDDGVDADRLFLSEYCILSENQKMRYKYLYSLCEQRSNNNNNNNNNDGDDGGGDDDDN